MESVILSERLKLSRATKAGRGSVEFGWLHQLRSDEKATWWSIHGRSKTMEDTEKTIKTILPQAEATEHTRRVLYVVHEKIEATNAMIEDEAACQNEVEKEPIGLVAMTSLDAGALELPPAFNPSVSSDTLQLELGYMFLPNAWGKGYATEAVEAVFESCKRAQFFWTPFSKLYIRAIVNDENPASMRVMDKTGFKTRGIYEWTGDPIFLAGKWQTRSKIHIYSRYLSME